MSTFFPDEGERLAFIDREIASLKRRAVPEALGVRGTAVSRGATQAIASVTKTKVSWDTVTYDLLGIWSAATPTQLTISASGLYLVDTCIEYASNAVGERNIGLDLNGAVLQTLVFNAAGGGSGTSLLLATTARLVPGDVLETTTIQSSGGNLNLQQTLRLSVARLGE